MIRWVDHWLNRLTMYRLVLYYLIFLLSAAWVFSALGILQSDPFALLFTIGFLVAACAITNAIFARVFNVPANAESVYISALILALIITPLQSPHDLWFLLWVSVWSMASKYIVAIGRKHLFNPVAFAVALTYLTINQSASWWVGSGPMLPLVLIGGLLIVRKLQRFDLVLSFLGAALGAILALSFLNGVSLFLAVQRAILYSPLVFFAVIILTEPLTTPPARRQRVAYGALVGLLFAPQLHIDGLYVTPELAILAGNLYTYLVSPKTRLALRLKEKVQLGPDLYDFVFAPARQFAYAPGQYMEWTLAHPDPDSRGNRRYFTMASSPTEKDLRLGVKFYPKSSSYKRALLELDANSEIVAAQVAGDFVLPNNPNQKCVFLAGGIGITPFRSMIKYLLDTNQRRPIVLFYATKTIQDIAYQDVFDRAQRRLGIRTIYTLTDARHVPPTWKGKVGHFSAQMIAATVPDYKQCRFYISGPERTVESFKAVLSQLNIPGSQIKTDFFPGF